LVVSAEERTRRLEDKVSAWERSARDAQLLTEDAQRRAEKAQEMLESALTNIQKLEQKGSDCI